LARTRTTKKIAQRIDLNYFKKPTALKRTQLLLSVLAPVAAVAWISSSVFTKDSRIYSSGRLSQAHAVLERDCKACHVETARTFSAKTENQACLQCHDGPDHHPVPQGAKTPSCASCHNEHRGKVHQSATANQACATCHGNLPATQPASRTFPSIRNFESDHPEFAALSGHDSRTIKLNHAVHLEPIRRGPNGPAVQLDCGSCHHSAAAEPDLTYSDASYRTAKISYKESDEILLRAAAGLRPARPATGREYLAPVRFADACAGCHLLTFDERFDFGVPHDRPEVVRQFLVSQFSEYIRAHPGALRETRNSERDLAGRPRELRTSEATAPEWVNARVRSAEELLWRKTCKQCHQIVPGSGSSLPSIAGSRVTTEWMPHAKFDHDAHRGFTCESCHLKAATSSDDAEILLPGIATCRSCHAPGPEHAESRCFECHTYHDWAKRKEVKPTFRLSGLPR
jgi:hypothetical protein